MSLKKDPRIQSGAIGVWSPHRFSLRQLQYVIAVAKVGGFRKAADLVHVSQPTLSSQITELEGQLGFQIFDRDTSPVEVTREAQDFVDAAQQVLHLASGLEDEAKRTRKPLTGPMRIGVIPTVAPFLIPTVAPLLRSHFPLLQVYWHEAKTADLKQLLERRTLDVAVLAEGDLGPLQFESIGFDPFVYAYPKADKKFRKKKFVTMAEVTEKPLLLLDEGHCLRDQALFWCSRPTSADEPAPTNQLHESEFRATSLHTLSEMVSAGLGSTLLPALATKSGMINQSLLIAEVKVSLNDAIPGRTLGLAYRPKHPSQTSYGKLAQVLREGFERAMDR